MKTNKKNQPVFGILQPTLKNLEMFSYFFGVSFSKINCFSTERKGNKTRSLHYLHSIKKYLTKAKKKNLRGVKLP